MATYLPTDEGGRRDADLVAAVEEALSTGHNSSTFNTLLTEDLSLDGIDAILHSSARRLLINELHGKTLREWLAIERFWNPEQHDLLRTPMGPASSLLYRAWEHLVSGVGAALERARGHIGLPDEGGVFAFVNRLQQCIALWYSFVGDSAKLVPVDVLEDPVAVFDVWDALERADGRTRNALKSILVSGQKLISHRGLLVHVDRSAEAHVFGPSIDTLLMSELLAQWLQSAETPPRSVLDIGSGSGLLTLAAARFGSPHRLVSLDSSFSAVSCTAKNLRSFQYDAGQSSPIDIHLLAGKFAPDLLPRFDLILCNPPYVPRPPEALVLPGSHADYRHAVGGLELAHAVLAELPQLLSEGGRLLLMTSELSRDDLMKSLPDGFQVQYPLGSKGRAVPFDLEAAYSDEEWLDFLVTNCNLREARKGTHWHALHPCWIEPT